ncbi:MAG: MASE1 domain-containing protein, partial [Shewanella sp.]
MNATAIRQTINWKHLFLFMALYLFFSYLSITLIHSPGQVTLYWPASGIALGFLVRYGLLWNIPLSICLLLMHLLFNPVPSIFIPFSIASNVIGVSLAATYIRTYQLNSYVSMRRGFILLRASILMSLTSAMIGVTGLCIAGLSSYADFWPGVAKWSMGDLLGIISTGPALLLLTSSKSNNPDAPTSSD